MDNLVINLKKIFILLLILTGLAIAVYLVQTKQIFKSRAFNSDANASLQVSDSNDQNMNYQGNNTWKVTSKTIHLRIKPEALEQLKD